jgi:hypothetical protein
MGKTTTYVGLDVHKDTIVVALAEMGVRGEGREYGKTAHTSASVKALTAKLASGHSELRRDRLKPGESTKPVVRRDPGHPPSNRSARSTAPTNARQAPRFETVSSGNRVNI